VNVIEAIHGRRSICAYRSDPVERAVLEEIVWAAAQAPTPPISGDTPWMFCIFDGIDRIDDYGVRAKQYARDHQPAGRPWTWADRPDFRVFWGAPALLLICARSGNPETRLDCCRAGQNAMLAAFHHGLGSCWVGAPMPWLRSNGVAEALGLPTDYEPAVAIVMGYAAESPQGLPRSRPTVIWRNTTLTSIP
jgi:nitroreductase